MLKMALAGIENFLHFWATGPNMRTISTQQTKRSREATPDSGTGKDDVEEIAHKKTKKCVVQRSEVDAFFKLLGDPLIEDFLSRDICRLVSDKYLLAMVFAYFKRACFTLRQFTRMNFFLALYLANDIEEDEEEAKYEILPWALGSSWQTKYLHFLKKKDKLWKKMEFRALVSLKCCEEIMLLRPDHHVWQRQRQPIHGGATRSYLKDPSDDGLPRGPNATPRFCSHCIKLVECDPDSPETNNWYLSSTSESSQDEGYRMRSVKVKRMDAIPIPTTDDMDGDPIEISSSVSDPEEIWARGDKPEASSIS
ncbi:hypothetical protein CAPTEDRAFT_223231, partial [Capitella teleta]